MKVEIDMKIAIYDDCYEDALHLKSLLKGHDTKIYADADSLLADIEDDGICYNLYLLDIYMDHSLDGIQLAEKLRAGDEEAAICFVSSSDAFYREAYDLYALQYLIKPVQEDALNQLIERVSNGLAKKKEQSFNFKWRGQARTIPYSKILFISSRGHMLVIQCKDGTAQECKGKLSEIEQQICGDMFWRCHQSFLVNMYQVDGLEGNELVAGGYRVPVSRRYYAEIKSRYWEILFEGVD